MRNGGGLIALAELANEDSTALLSFETVYEGALDADLWILNAFATPDLDALAAQDARYADFAAFQSGNVWNNDLVVNENGGTDFFERGAAFPQLILADIIAILHPELLPDHEFNFFRQLD
jgi:iron complex transport system substrate-binding protein